MLHWAAVMTMVVLAAGLPWHCEALTLAQSLSSHTTWRDLLQTAGLWDMLNGADPYTIFVPSDSYLQRYLASHHTSIAQLKQNPESLSDFLKYHIVKGNVTRDQLFNERLLQTLNGENIRINDYNGRVAFQGVTVQQTVSSTSNGIIYWLYDPLTAANGSVADIVQGQPDLSALASAVQAAGLEEFLTDQNPITLLAPTNAAFQALGQDRFSALLKNPSLLAKILEYHVIPGTLYSVGIARTQDFPTFEEADKLHIYSIGSAFTVEGSQAVRSGVDISATNGVVHKIDHVLIPSSLRGQV